MFKDASDHLQAELRRLDLLLLRYLRLQEEKGERSENVGVIPDLSTQHVSGYRRVDPDASVEEIESALREHAEFIRGRVRASGSLAARLPIVEICRTLSLDARSLGMLILALSHHFDRKYQRIFAALQAGAIPDPRLGLALDVFGHSPEERHRLLLAYSPTSPLLRSGFFWFGDPPEGVHHSRLDQTLNVSPRLLRFIIGNDVAEPVVEAMRLRLPLPEPTNRILENLRRVNGLWNDEGAAPVVLFRTEDGEAALNAAGVLAGARGYSLLLLDLANPDAQLTPIAARVEAAFREARLQGALLGLLGLAELAEAAAQEALRAIEAECERFDGPLIVITPPEPDLRRCIRRRPIIQLEVGMPDPMERESLWRAVLPSSAAHKAPDLAWRFRLTSSQIHDAAKMAPYVGPGPTGDTLIEACHAQSRHRLGEYASRLPTRNDWNALVLPDMSRVQLDDLVMQVRYRDFIRTSWAWASKTPGSGGLTALFVGPPGTGKTMAASLIGGKLGLTVYRIDLAGIVSKYIGETEKNLDRVFRAAERSNAVLFFDEADALFGKRTEVKDAHDRYANIETSYLLQKIEEFEGLTILASNLKKNIDEAFVRRLQVIVDFPFPDPKRREQLWPGMIPDRMPLDADIDWIFLAHRFELSGGHIKNAIQTAAVIAAATEKSVGMKELLIGVRRELLKQGKILNSVDFGPFAELVMPGNKVGEPSNKRST